MGPSVAHAASANCAVGPARTCVPLAASGALLAAFARVGFIPTPAAEGEAGGGLFRGITPRTLGTGGTDTMTSLISSQVRV